MSQNGIQLIMLLCYSKINWLSTLWDCTHFCIFDPIFLDFWQNVRRQICNFWKITVKFSQLIVFTISSFGLYWLQQGWIYCKKIVTVPWWISNCSGSENVNAYFPFMYNFLCILIPWIICAPSIIFQKLLYFAFWALKVLFYLKRLPSVLFLSKWYLNIVLLVFHNKL